MPNGDTSLGASARDQIHDLAAELVGSGDTHLWDKMLDKILETYYPKDAFPTLWKIMEDQSQVRGVMKGVAAEAFSLGLRQGALEATMEFQSLVQEAQTRKGTTGS